MLSWVKLLHIFWGTHALASLGFIIGSRTAGLQGEHMSLYQCSSTYVPTVTYERDSRSTFLPKLAKVFLIPVILLGIWYYLIIILICISLKNNDTKHFPLFFWPLMTYLFKSLVHFPNLLKYNLLRVKCIYFKCLVWLVLHYVTTSKSIYRKFTLGNSKGPRVTSQKITLILTPDSYSSAF